MPTYTLTHMKHTHNMNTPDSSFCVGKAQLLIPSLFVPAYGKLDYTILWPRLQVPFGVIVFANSAATWSGKPHRQAGGTLHRWAPLEFFLNPPTPPDWPPLPPLLDGYPP